MFYAHSTVDLGMKLELGVVVKDLKDGSLPYLHGVRVGDEICQVYIHLHVHVCQAFKGYNIA